MPNERDYRKEAAEFFRPQRRFLLWNVALVAVVPPIRFLNTFDERLHEAVSGTLLIALMLAIFFCMIRMLIVYGEWMSWRCPRCRKTFRRSWYWPGSPWDCAHCGLTLTPSWWRAAEPFWEAKPSSSWKPAGNKTTEDSELRQ